MKHFKLLLCFLISLHTLVAQDGTFILEDIRIDGNKITKEKIILRELSFKVGDTLSYSDSLSIIAVSENNLYNTSLFNITEVYFKKDNNAWYAEIVLQERWYLWPQVTVKFQERNFSEWWKNKNFSRIDYGVHINRNNFLGLNQTLQGQFFYGFTQKFGVKYQIPYLTHRQKHGIKIAASYSTQDEIFSGVKNNEMLYIKNDSDLIFSNVTAISEYTRRNGFYALQTIGIEFKQLQGRNELKEISKAYFGKEGSFLRYVGINYWFKIDKRFSKNYPLKGYFFDVSLKQFGLGKFDKSDLNITSIASNYRKYHHISERHYIAAGAHLRYFPQKEIPFLFQQGLGFHEYVRGYEPYVIFGQVTTLAKVNYKYEIIKPRQFTVPFIKKWKKFSKAHFALYGNLFTDAGYVYDADQSNSLVNEFLLGIGAGLDWVTYYDTVIRTEFSVNKDGLYGVYLNFVAPI